jgi:hypothetical protein
VVASFVAYAPESNPALSRQSAMQQVPQFREESLGASTRSSYPLLTWLEGRLVVVVSVWVPPTLRQKT